MELLGGLIGAGLLAASPLVPGLRPIAKAVVKSGMAVADATVAVAAAVTHQVGDLVAHVRSADAGETVVDADAASEAPTPAAPLAGKPQSAEAVETSADLASAAGVSLGAPSLRPAAKAAVKGSMALADTAKGAAGAAAGAAALTGQQLSGLAARISPKKKAGDEAPVGEDLPPEAADGAAGQRSGDVPADGVATDQTQPAVADDLVQISGIGPKMASLLQVAGISTFADLAATSVEDLQGILAQAGPRYRVTDPSTWPAQAQALMDAPAPQLPLSTTTCSRSMALAPRWPTCCMLRASPRSATGLDQCRAAPGDPRRGDARLRMIDPSTWPAQAQALLARTQIT